MIQNNIFSPIYRKTLSIILSIFTLCTFCLLIGFDGNAKILMLYVNLISIMGLIIVYKNSINKYELSIFFLLCIMLMAYAPKLGELGSDLRATSLAVSYRYGLSSRGLIATFIDIITQGQFINKNFVWHFIFSSTVFISFIISIYLGYIIQNSKNETKLFVFLTSLIYISCFTSISVYYTRYNFARTEIFALLFMLILLVIIDKQKIRWLIPILALFTVATHLILVFFYIPFIGIMLLYHIIIKKDTRKSTIFLLIATVCIVLAAFIFYILFREYTFKFEHLRDFFQYLTGKTNLKITEVELQNIMYGSLEHHLDEFYSVMRSPRIVQGLFLCIVINIPILSAFIIFWGQCIKKSENKVNKFVFTLPLLIIPFHAIAFLMFFDYGRWMTMIITVQFMFLFYMIYKNNSIVITVIEKYKCIFDRWKYVIIMACLLMIFLGPVTQMDISENIARIISGFMMVLGIDM